MQEYFIEAGGLKTRVVEWGDKDKPVILALHGNGRTCYDFLEIASLLSNDYRLLSVDLPGHGKTKAFSDPANYSYPQTSEWLHDVIKALEINNFNLLGHSQGAYIALFYFAKYGYMVKKMLLLDGGYANYQKVINYNIDKKVLPQQFNVNNLQEFRTNAFKKAFESIIDFKIDSIENFITEEREGYSRWSELLDEVCRQSIIEIDGKLQFHATAEVLAHSTIAICDNFPDMVYPDVLQKNQNKILLLACQYPDSDCYREIIDIMVKDFQNATSSVVHRHPLSHMMHWDNPNLIAQEIIEWFE